MKFSLSTQCTGWTMTKTEAALVQVSIEEGSQVEYAVDAYLNANAVTVMGALVPPKRPVSTGVVAYLSMSTPRLTLVTSLSQMLHKTCVTFEKVH